jgi:hypothetical protein
LQPLKETQIDVWLPARSPNANSILKNRRHGFRECRSDLGTDLEAAHADARTKRNSQISRPAAELGHQGFNARPGHALHGAPPARVQDRARTRAWAGHDDGRAIRHVHRKPDARFVAAKSVGL